MNPWKCIPIYLTVDADNAEAGLWCWACQLPSVIKFPIVQLSEIGVGQVGFYEACMECGDFEEGGDGDDSDDLVGC